MALVDAHLLAGRISETSREREPFDEQINVGVMLCLGRLINSVVGGMGPELVSFAQTDRMQQLWACWGGAKESKFEIIQEECLFYVEQVAMFFPQDKGLDRCYALDTSKLNEWLFIDKTKSVQLYTTHRRERA